MVWRINKNGEREQIQVSLGDIWKDADWWYIQLPNGRLRQPRKMDCEEFRAQMVKDGLIDAVSAYGY
tara:strand:- start:1136 stop:1336 length:201 start_codon:yes stop_codon:yes gene_type:complete